MDSVINDLYINGLFLILLSKIGDTDNASSALIPNNPHTTESYVQQAISIVEDFYGTELTVNTIADKLNINRSYLSSIFARHTGTTLKKYIVDFRISQSEEFLFTTNWTVDYISKVCGFGNSSYFSKMFRDKHGLSPSEYRKHRLKKI